MRSRHAWLVGAAGATGAAAVLVARRLRRGRREVPAADSAADPAADPAAALRQKLDESRALTEEREEFEAGETTVDRAEPAGETVEERRRRVHREAKTAVDDMHNRWAEPGPADEPPA